MCADESQNDCLERTEFESLINQEGTIETLAFDTTGSVDAVEKSCAQVFLAIDKNEDRLLSASEALKWILNYADESIVGATEKEKKRYYRLTARAKAFGENYDPANWREPIVWPDFLKACKEVALKDVDPLVA